MKYLFILLIFVSCAKEQPPIDDSACNFNPQILMIDETWFRSAINDVDYEIITGNDELAKRLERYSTTYSIGEDGGHQFTFSEPTYNTVVLLIESFEN